VPLRFAANEQTKMAKTRKLFVAHASELAHRLVRWVRPDALISEFAKSYARKHRRHGVVDDTARIRELEQTLGRESILVMLAEIHRVMPTALGAGRNGFSDPERAKFARMFQDEFETALHRALDWPASEAAAEREAFARDLEMYEQTSEINAPLSTDPDKRDSPFYDRCALLLDPSMMEVARSAAAAFEKQLVSAAAEIVAQLGTGGESRSKPAQSTLKSQKRTRAIKKRAKKTSKKPPGKPKQARAKKAKSARRTPSIKKGRQQPKRS
jgi:hypothetical protein